MNLRATEIESRVAVDKISPLIAVEDVVENTTKLGQQATKQFSDSQPSSLLNTPTTRESGRLNAQNFTPLNAFDNRLFRVEQTYNATVERQLTSQTAIVAMNGTFVPVKIGQQFSVGETIQLKYLGSIPSPSFMLMQGASTPNLDVANISASGSLIQHYLNAAPQTSSSTHIESGKPITSNPSNSIAQIASDLKQTLTQTGLFYESHLASYLTGQLSKGELLREPQNLLPQSQQHIISQQLNLLEHPKITWHGEVWPQQPMQWDIQVNHPIPSPFHTSLNVNEDGSNAHQHPDNTVVTSKIALELPNLGHITAEMQMKNGKLHLRVLADSEPSTQTLKQGQQALFEKLKSAGLIIDRISIGHQHVDQST